MIVRAAFVVIAAVLALGGCRPDEEFAGADLSSAALYCPPDPPLTTLFACDPSAIPYCTYLDQQLNCVCSLGPDGIYLLRCMPIHADGGATPD
jgi:hypothetical protein